MNNFRVLLFVLLLSSCSQEKILFYPDKLPANFNFSFDQPFQELYFQQKDGIRLHGLLFPVTLSKGLVFYLHGNGGSNRYWGSLANVYTRNGYDFFVLDYRGYGKSEGKISGEEELYGDVHLVYDSLKKRYSEKDLIIIGYSLGTGPATELASSNQPKLLILKAPYFSMLDMAHQYASAIPESAVKYKFRTDLLLPAVKCPVIIFHGNKDEVIGIEAAERLKKLFKKGDRLIVLPNQKHNGINENPLFQHEIERLLHL